MDQRQARKTDFSAIPLLIQEELLSQDLLQRWGHRTLVDRQHLIKQRFGLDISYYKLRKFYQTNGIGWRNTQMVYRSHW